MAATWTPNPPTQPGTYSCRFASDQDGIDSTPFNVELVPDHFNGGVCVRWRYGQCLPLGAYERCEWLQGLATG